MNTKAWLMPGQPCGRHIILEQSSRGNRAQRYRAHDPAMNQPVLITCAKACRDHEKPRFEAPAGDFSEKWGLDTQEPSPRS